METVNRTTDGGNGRPAKDPIAEKRRIGYIRRYSRRTVERD